MILLIAFVIVRVHGQGDDEYTAGGVEKKCFALSKPINGNRAVNELEEFSDVDLVFGRDFNPRMRMSTLTSCIKANKLYGMGLTLADVEDQTNTLELGYWGSKVEDGCIDLPIAADDGFLSIDIYYGSLISGLRLTFLNGTRIYLGRRQSGDLTRTISFDIETYEIVGMKGNTTSGRILDLQAIVFDNECGLENYKPPLNPPVSFDQLGSSKEEEIAVLQIDPLETGGPSENADNAEAAEPLTELNPQKKGEGGSLAGFIVVGVILVILAFVIIIALRRTRQR